MNNTKKLFNDASEVYLKFLIENINLQMIHDDLVLWFKTNKQDYTEISIEELNKIWFLYEYNIIDNNNDLYTIAEKTLSRNLKLNIFEQKYCNVEKFDPFIYVNDKRILKVNVINGSFLKKLNEYISKTHFYINDRMDNYCRIFIKHKVSKNVNKKTGKVFNYVDIMLGFKCVLPEYNILHHTPRFNLIYKINYFSHINCRLFNKSIKKPVIDDSIKTYKKEVLKIINIISKRSDIENSVMEFNNLHIPEKYYDEMVLFIYDHIMTCIYYVSPILNFLLQINTKYFIENILKITIDKYHNPSVYTDTDFEDGEDKTKRIIKDNFKILIQLCAIFKSEINIIDYIQLLFDNISTDLINIDMLNFIVNTKEVYDLIDTNLIIENIRLIQEDNKLNIPIRSKMLLLDIRDQCNRIVVQ